MFPNYASSEAVLASEMLYFSQERCDLEAFSACMHPFIRNTVGSMDFGGSALNKFYNGNNTPNRGSKRITSDVFALATAVLFQSPVQHFALAPNNLTDAPDWAIDFMKKVPNTWDEIKLLTDTLKIYYHGQMGQMVCCRNKCTIGTIEFKDYFIYDQTRFRAYYIVMTNN